MRQRVIDRCLGQARRATQAGQFADAEAALDEVRSLAPDLPDVRALTAELEERRREAEARRPRRSWWPAIAALLALLLSGWALG